MMKKACYFMSKALLVLDIFTFLARIFGYVGKRFDEKAKVAFILYFVTGCITDT